MTLPFSTKLKGKPTYFVEKILRGIEISKDPINLLEYWKFTGFDLFSKQMIKPKLHTIRDDKNDRWKVATKIDFFINARQKSMFRFAPVLPVVSIQEFVLEYELSSSPIGRGACVWIDNVKFWWFDDINKDDQKMLHFAQNDGFDTIEDFFAYFNKDFTGKLIHWTDLKY